MTAPNRPTIELKTPHGHVVVLKEYATGREKNALQNTYLEHTKISVVGNQPKIDEFSPKAEEATINKMLEMFVVSVDGVTEGVVDLVLDLRVEDYDAVVEGLNEITGKKKRTE